MGGEKLWLGDPVSAWKPLSRQCHISVLGGSSFLLVGQEQWPLGGAMAAMLTFSPHPLQFHPLQPSSTFQIEVKLLENFWFSTGYRFRKMEGSGKWNACPLSVARVLCAEYLQKAILMWFCACLRQAFIVRCACSVCNALICACMHC